MSNVILNEKLINQAVRLIATVKKGQIEALKNAKSCDDTIRVDFEMGVSHWFKHKPVNHYLTEFGVALILECDGEQLEAVFDRCQISPENEEKTGIYSRKLLNKKFLSYLTTVDYSTSVEG